MKRSHVAMTERPEEEEEEESQGSQRVRLVEDTSDGAGTVRDLGELQAYGLQPNGRLEVLWDIVVEPSAEDTVSKEGETEGQDNVVQEDGEGGTRHSEWWCATLGEPLPLRDPQGNRRVWQIHYEEKEGFPRTTCQVVFHSSNVLYDLECQCHLKWRIEGDLDGEDEEKEQVVLSLQDCLEAIQGETQTNPAQDTSELDALQSLPILQQQRIATGFRRFADNLKTKLKELVEEKGDGYVVQASDIQDIVKDAHS